MASMSEAERDAFLQETRIATLVTLNADGSPNAVPLWHEWDGSRLRMFSMSSTGKLRRLSHDPRACVTVHAPVGVPEAWVRVEGTVELLDEGAKELALRLAARYYTGERRKRTLESWSRADGWVLLELTPTRIRSSV